jgi:hypothetical protein
MLAPFSVWIRRLALGAATAWSLIAQAQPPVHVVILEPLVVVDTQGAEVRQSDVLYRRAPQPEKYLGWLRNASAERAFALYRSAWDIARPGKGTPDYYIALVKGGNHAAVGFRVREGDHTVNHSRQPYILLDAEQSRFEDTLLHETGHMAMALLAGGRQLQGSSMAAIPHTTAALTDRNTAFSEGWAIHLETLQAHLTRDAAARRRFHREAVIFSDGPLRSAEYFRQSADLASYAQSLARYLEVRENNYAFESAYQGPDYLRVQLEKARDFATPRDANQLLQSEGYYASFFFLWAVRGAQLPPESVVAEREAKMMRAMQAALQAEGVEQPRPWLPLLVREYFKLFPNEKALMADTLNDTSHGVFVDAAAVEVWRQHYMAALRLDVANLNAAGINAARKRWREAVLADPAVLLARLGPEVHCALNGAKVKLEALGEEMPVEFDVNTVQAAVLRLIPGITEAEIAKWVGERSRRPFTDAADFQARAVAGAAAMAHLKF